ncbi:Flagellar basal-body rod protein FlgG [Posidoniimonas polymericola]|uniref:Flagellar basal-body rod protein FlgG n=1 Tax=Posidoniimonas polymericola TaxID=2528002 RepID=A0A5C5YDU8_9BACT|nr:flagellar basal-body rod protein FlgG [Posidoniimonas polymericola]TWT73530.1 Flagellar basal-body rod protein FlgG [Posidoniimonas polymericola]
MSVQTLYTAATGMEALETKLDVIANNMANINTTGFKKDRANFEDLFYRQHKLPGALDSDGNITSTGIDVGLGVRVSSMQADFDQGAFQQTGNQLDFAIEGNGFFEVTGPNGEQQYTRAGNFGINANGDLVLGSANNGYRMNPNINIPAEAIDVVVSNDGTVQYSTAGSPTLSTAGNITLTTFINPDGLIKLGDNLFKASDASGNAQSGLTPGQQGVGILRQGSLEASNVEPVTELIDLITTQRAFELNSQVVQAGDQVMQIVANLRRG